jgi:hypothetical protein
MNREQIPHITLEPGSVSVFCPQLGQEKATMFSLEKDKADSGEHDKKSLPFFSIKSSRAIENRPHSIG